MWLTEIARALISPGNISQLMSDWEQMYRYLHSFIPEMSEIFAYSGLQIFTKGNNYILWQLASKASFPCSVQFARSHRWVLFWFTQNLVNLLYSNSCIRDCFYGNPLWDKGHKYTIFIDHWCDGHILCCLLNLKTTDILFLGDFLTFCFQFISLFFL